MKQTKRRSLAKYILLARIVSDWTKRWLSRPHLPMLHIQVLLQYRRYVRLMLQTYRWPLMMISLQDLAIRDVHLTRDILRNQGRHKDASVSQKKSRKTKLCLASFNSHFIYARCGFLCVKPHSGSLQIFFLKKTCRSFLVKRKIFLQQQKAKSKPALET